ncbi:hypothetical protein C8J35_107285 [Rhizobium sp. PP-F2F-G38]|uniref:Uncharacterized protein n=1 Tax=Ferranicluibacter rubi TaxID=2715133 RepID=A0AA43ZD57_9HYPH|nr:hypothetical protein [Ferranicluibacter rubi]NHT75625.1 hypothetical protein [Ferranicluibacter rubi]PYE96126.1 hypothetical protein C8J35_107285 [Rhizobium sp. PP-F2F-G38]TCQ23067.1 hypothetical protein C8J33_105286 [Rhizobium sp. PP-CC-3G-465]
MADSESSRTLPGISIEKNTTTGGKADEAPTIISRRNLLSHTARVLQHCFTDMPPRTERGPASVREIWLRWWILQQQHLRQSRRVRKLSDRLLDELDGYPSVAIDGLEGEPPYVATTYAEIRHLSSRIDAGRLDAARSTLRQRRQAWKKADARIGYSAAVRRERDLDRSAGISANVVLLMPPFSLMEVAAKLHCLLELHDPRLRHEHEPWLQLRRMLKELVDLRQRPDCEH